MRTVTLGNTGISVSRLGMGTGTAHPSGHCRQALMSEQALAALLLHAFDRGITLWDSAVQYGTHAAVRRALRQLGRHKVTIVTKIIATGAAEAEALVHRALQELGTDHVDVCLLHAIRTRREFSKSAPALAKLAALKEKGLIRAVAMSCHGLGGLEAALASPVIEAVWARINYAGRVMDSARMGLADSLAAVPLLKKTVKLLPKWCIALVRPDAHAPPVSGADHRRVTDLLTQMHRADKGVVGMKIMGQGLLGADPAKAIKYAAERPFLDAFIIGMLTREEINTNCDLVNQFDR